MTFETPTHPGSQAAGVTPDTNCEDAAPARRKARHRPWPRRARRGMVGMLLTIALVAIAIVYLISLYVQSNNSIRTQAAQNTITNLESEIRRSYANAPQYTAEDYHEFIAPRMPQSALRGAAPNEEIVTPWGGVIEAGGGNTIGTSAASNDEFWIEIQELPRSACIAISESFLNRTDVVGIDADGTFAAMTAAIAALHDTAAEIEASCDDADDNDIGVVFRG